MGCDIHCYIEYKPTGYDRWFSFGGRINPGRNYALFAKMAGVRNYDEVIPVSQPKGFPNDASSKADGDHWLYISDVEMEGCCTFEQAERFVQMGSRYQDKEKTFVSHPDWHSHSWLTPDEFEQAIFESSEAQYRAILAAMRSFERDGHQSRLVFWFDN